MAVLAALMFALAATHVPAVPTERGAPLVQFQVEQDGDAEQSDGGAEDAPEPSGPRPPRNPGSEPGPSTPEDTNSGDSEPEPPAPEVGGRDPLPLPTPGGDVPDPEVAQEESEDDLSPQVTTVVRDEVLYVSPSGSRRSPGLAASRPTSVSAALRRADSQPGTTEIVLMPGTYGAIALRRVTGMTIRAAEPGTATISSRFGPAMDVAFSEDIILTGLEFSDSRAGVSVTNSERVVILDNAIRDTGGAVVISGSDGVQVDRNLITRTGIGRQSGAAINVFDSIATVIHGNHVERSDVAAIFTRSAATISDNTLIAIAAPSGAAVTSTSDGSLMFGNIVWHTSTGAAINIPNGDGVTGNIAISFSQEAVEHASGTVRRNLLLSEGPAVEGNLGHEVLEAAAFDQGFFADEVLSPATLRLLELLDDGEIEMEEVLPTLDAEYSTGALDEETPLDLIERILAERDQDPLNEDSTEGDSTEGSEDVSLEDPLRPGPSGPIGTGSPTATEDVSALEQIQAILDSQGQDSRQDPGQPVEAAQPARPVDDIDLILALIELILRQDAAAGNDTSPADSLDVIQQILDQQNGSPATNVGGDAPTTVPADGALPLGAGALPPSAPVPVAGGQTLWVSPNGSDGASGNEQDPLQTIQAAVNRATPGTTILLTSGRWEGQGRQGRGFVNFEESQSGTEGAWIRLLAAPGAEPHLVISQGEAIRIEGHHVEVSGLHIEGINGGPGDPNGGPGPHYGYGILATNNAPYEQATEAHHLVFTNNEIHGFSTSGIGATGINWVVVANNHVYENANWGPEGGSGISLVESTNIGGPAGEDGYTQFIVGNDVHDNQQLVPSTKINLNFVSDGNCIILDRLDHGAISTRTLISGNVAHSCGGRGVNLFESSRVDVVGNLTWQNGHTANLSGELAGLGEDIRWIANVVVPRSGRASLVGSGSDEDNTYLDPGTSLAAARDLLAERFSPNTNSNTDAGASQPTTDEPGTQEASADSPSTGGSFQAILLEGESTSAWNGGSNQFARNIGDVFPAAKVQTDGRNGHRISEVLNEGFKSNYLVEGNTVAVLWIGINDIVAGTPNEEIYAGITRWVGERRSEGWDHVAVVTLHRFRHSASGDHQDDNGDRQILNQLIRDNGAGADIIADLAQTSEMGDNSDPTNPKYLADGVHPTPEGSRVISDVVADALRRLG